MNEYGEKRNGFAEVVAFCHVTCRYFDRFLLQGVDKNWRQACFFYLAPGLISEVYWQVNSRRSIFRIADPIILKVKIPKMHRSLNGFNSTAMLMSCRNSRKGIVLRIQLKAMSGHLEISTLGEWQGMNSMTLMTSVQKTCLTIRAKPATGYASSCVKFEGLMHG